MTWESLRLEQILDLGGVYRSAADAFELLRNYPSSGFVSLWAVPTPGWHFKPG